MPFSLVRLRNTMKHRTRIREAACVLMAALLMIAGPVGCSQQHSANGNRSIYTMLDTDESVSLAFASPQMVCCEYGRKMDFGIEDTDPKHERRVDLTTGGPIEFSPMVAHADEFNQEMRSYQPDWSDSGVWVMFANDGDVVVRRPAGGKRGVESLATIDPKRLEDGRVRLTFTSKVIENFYGLGEQFGTPGQVNGDWGGRKRTPGCEWGNALVKFHGGFVGNAQFPILYCVGDDKRNFAIFVDDTSAQTWDFTQADAADANGVRTWTLTVPKRDEPLRWFVITGKDLPSLRRQYMQLVGLPPVPPKKMFGLWVSEYGFNDWAELDDKLRTLRANHFPIDGFVMDLQWFGDIRKEYKGSQMGSLTWDEDKFPNPAEKIASLQDKEGVGIMTIEEPYVDEHLPEYKTMASRGYLVRDSSGEKPATIKSWWGTGAMIDYTNRRGADDWHDTKREPLIKEGVMAHWTDLGEPETCRADLWYMNSANPGHHSQADVHNLFNFRWAESIARGYQRNHQPRAPFILSRSGTSGIDRFGAAMWSGDIGSNLASYAAHLNVQMMMSMSGMDYFGSDIGGFRRDSLMGDDEDEMYTRWFAHACLLDVPVRPHTSNTENKYETAPDRIGDLKSNLFNLRRRYALTPYLYSLACAAQLTGEPVFPPLVYYYQNDDRVREMADEKMIGRDLLMAVDVKPGERRRSVYLPAGDWYDFETGKLYKGDKGRDVAIDPTRADGVFTPPLFARAGAIIPMMRVDDKTMNVMGKRTDGTNRDEMIVRVFADNALSSFALFAGDALDGTSHEADRQRQDIHQWYYPISTNESDHLRSDASARIHEVYISRPIDVDDESRMLTYVVRIYLPYADARIRNVQIGRRPFPLTNSGQGFADVGCEAYESLEQTDRTPGTLRKGWSMVKPGVVEVISGEMPITENVLFMTELDER